jgi:hypothetical protein
MEGASGSAADQEGEAEDLDRLFAEGEPPLLRVTVTVQDNK